MRISQIAIGLALALLPRLAAAADGEIALDHPFSLVDADGKTVTEKDFPGKFLLVYFGYIHCADQCPTALTTMVEALDEIGPAARYVQPLFITVDPEHDRGLALRRFTAAFDPRLIGLTGTPDQIADAAASLGVKYEKVLLGNEDYVVDHSSTMALVDPSGSKATSFKIAEPHLVAAKLFEVLGRAGVSLADVDNLGAYR
ncbi:MAG: Classical-complement-pathway convertase [Rhodospirillales bacterium]|jgi:protein SCO1/2|nr:Classical-complement-pathway convertase [Rhodospirillales bacterium]